MKKLFCCISDPGVEDTRTGQLGADTKRAVTSDISSSRGQKRVRKSAHRIRYAR